VIGTVIVYKEEAYVFEDQDPREALRAFLEHWYPKAKTGLVLYPIGGVDKHQETTTYSGPWAREDG